MTRRGPAVPKPSAKVWHFICAAILAGIVIISSPPRAIAQGVTMSPELNTALDRLRDALSRSSHPASTLSEHDRAVLFANNDKINAAALNGRQIDDSLYQAAQSDYDMLNQGFAEDAAKAAGAKFTVQKRSSSTFSPGTDSD